MRWHQWGSTLKDRDTPTERQVWLELRIEGALRCPTVPALGWLPHGSNDTTAMHQVTARGLTARAVSAMRIEPVLQRGLVLGYRAINEATIRAGVVQLAESRAEWQRLPQRE